METTNCTPALIENQLKAATDFLRASPATIKPGSYVCSQDGLSVYHRLTRIIYGTGPDCSHFWADVPRVRALDKLDAIPFPTKMHFVWRRDAIVETFL
jgi:hypothetical protein